MAYLAIAVQYAALTPDWQVPDEPAHYNYVRYIEHTGALPILQQGHYNQRYLEQFTNPANTPDMPIDPLRYEFHQPPLYYLIAAPISALTGGSLFALRMVSVAFGGALIVVAFLIVREATPQRPALALGVAAFVAFVPQHVAMMAGVNNDSLAELLLALIVLQTFRILRLDETKQLKESRALAELTGLGVLLGLGLITKTTVYLAVPIVLIALLWPGARWSGLSVARRMSFVLIPALAIGSLWWIRNLGVYGGFDVLGLARHNAVVVGQPLTADWIARMGFGPYLASALTTTFHSFWGQFGWMGVPMPDWVYLGLGALSIAALVGWLATRPAFHRIGQLSNQLSNYRTVALTLLVLFTIAAYAWYNLTFVQHQGRYLFPALIPLGLVFSIGIGRWARLLPRRIGPLAYAAAFVALAALCLFALHRFVIPSLSV